MTLNSIELSDIIIDSKALVVSYKDQVYHIPQADLDAFFRDPEIDSRTKARAVDKGMGLSDPDRTYGCTYCLFVMGFKRYDISEEDDCLEEVSTGLRCRYPGTAAIRIAGAKEDKSCSPKKNPKKYMAEKIGRCVLDESLIEELHERGLLEKYAVPDGRFCYSTLDELNDSPELKSVFEIRPEKKTLRDILKI